MLEKISKALGDELAAQVEAKLKEAGIEVGVTNDGTLVPADKHETVKNDLKLAESAKKGAEEQLGKVQGQLKELSEKPDTSEQVKADLAKVQGEFTTYKTNAEKQIATVKKQAAVERALVTERANPEATEYLISLIDVEKVELDDKGGVKGWEDLVKPLKESKKSLFAVDSLAGNRLPNPKPGDPPGTTGKQRYDAAMAKLQKNPTDRQAQTELFQAKEQMAQEYSDKS